MSHPLPYTFRMKNKNDLCSEPNTSVVSLTPCFSKVPQPPRDPSTVSTVSRGETSLLIFLPSIFLPIALCACPPKHSCRMWVAPLFNHIRLNPSNFLTESEKS